MKRIIIYATFIAMTLLMCGCQNEPPSTSEVDSTTTPENSTSDFLLVDETDINPTELELSFESIPSSGNLCLLEYEEDKYLVVVNEDDNDLYYEYDAKKKSSKLLAKTQPTILGSGEYVITQDNVLYQANAYNNENSSTLIKVDLANKKTEKIIDYEGWPPFQYLRLIDENTLLVFRPKLIESGETLKYSYHVERFSISDRTTETLIEIPDSTKQFISAYDYANNYIYTYQGETSLTTEYYVCSYDINGTLLKKYDVTQLLNSLAENEHILRMYVYENYFLFFSNNSSFYMLQSDSNDVLQKISLPNADTYTQYRYYRHPKKPGSFGCLYDENNQYLYRYDTTKQCFVKQKVLIKEENLALLSIKEKLDGSLLLSLYDYTVPMDNSKIIHYHIPALNS